MKEIVFLIIHIPERMSSNSFNLVCNLSEDTSPPSSKVCFLSSKVALIPLVFDEISYNKVTAGLLRKLVQLPYEYRYNTN
jgi:hypothetical protein